MIGLSEQNRNELLSLRRHFHAHPELSMEERQTADFIEHWLLELGLAPIRVGEHGLCATVRANRPGCKTVALRAEMDALAVAEKNEFPWRSQTAGVMHACGHDGILACALILAKLCTEHRDNLPVNVKFLFQSAEENGQGTFLMLDNGVMEGVDYFIMYHFVNDAPSGVELHQGASSATIGSVSLTIHGRASHWCTSELGVDSIGAAGKILAVIEMLNRTYESDFPFILGIGTIQGGTAKNIMAEETTMEGSLRACRKEDYFQLRSTLLDQIAQVEKDCGVTIDTFIEDHPIPPLWNDDALVDLGLTVGKPLWDDNCRLVTTQYLSGDSASYYFEHAKGIFFVFTAEKAGVENYPLHNGKFDFDEAVMEEAVIFMFEYLENMGRLDEKSVSGGAMKILNYKPKDCQTLTELFYNTVHSVNARDYTLEQLDVWATGQVDLAKWDTSLRSHDSIVAWMDGIIVGFGDMDKTGYLDRLYVHKDYQGQGIATAICDRLESAAPVNRFTTHASITARPFFEHRGYRVVKEQHVERQGILLTNYVMEKL